MKYGQKKATQKTELVAYYIVGNPKNPSYIFSELGHGNKSRQQSDIKTQHDWSQVLFCFSGFLANSVTEINLDGNQTLKRNMTGHKFFFFCFLDF